MILVFQRNHQRFFSSPDEETERKALFKNIAMIHAFKLSLPAFKALQQFEWIGYPDIPIDIVQDLLGTHKHLRGLGIMVENLPAMGISAYDGLRKLLVTARKSADMREIRTLLDRNEYSLKHLVLGGLAFPFQESWDLVFESETITNLTHFHLMTRVSHFMLTRIAAAHNLQSLTLPGVYVDLDAASLVFASDRIVDGSHTLMPHLEAFRILLRGESDRLVFHQSLAHFLRKRDKLRRLDLGNCPWNIVRDILPDLRNLRVVAVHIDRSSQEVMKSLVESISRDMVAIKVFANISDEPLYQYACYFSHFHALSFLHLQAQPDPGFRGPTDEGLCSIATTIPSLDFLVWDYMPCVVLRSTEGRIGSVRLEDLPMNRCNAYGAAVDFGSDDAAWLEQKDVPMRS